MGWALPVAAIGMQVVGQLAQGQAASASSKYNAAVAENNAKTAEQNAQWVGAEADQKVANEGLKNKERSGKIITNQAASGIDVNSGSAVDVRTSEAMLNNLDAQTIRSNAAREAYGYTTQASNFRGQAEMDRYSGKAAKTMSYIGAAGSVLGGAYTASRNGWELPSDSSSSLNSSNEGSLGGLY